MAWWLVMLAAGTGMQAAPAPPPPPPKPGDVVINGRPKKVCERMTTLGSIIPTRVCHSPEEWEEMREQARLAVQDMQDAQLQRQNGERHRQGQ